MKNDVQWSVFKAIRLNAQTLLKIRYCCKPNLQEQLRVKAFKQLI